MNKAITGVIIGSILIPGLTFAQTTDNTALIQQLYQLLAVLEQEIAQIEAQQQSTPIQSTQTTPLFGGTLQTTQESQPMPTDKSAITVENEGQQGPATDQMPYKQFYLKVRVLDENGNTVNQAPVSMTVNGQTENAKIDTKETPQSIDYYHTFSFAPQTSGDTSITFTSGNLSTTTTITVQ